MLFRSYAEELASLEFSGRDMERLRDVLLGCLSDPEVEAVTIRRAVDRVGLTGLRERIESLAGLSKQWCVKEGAAERDVEEVLRQALALHRRERALHKELKSAEILLAEDASDENLVRLREIKAELAAFEGREATIEGFGGASGLPERNN